MAESLYPKPQPQPAYGDPNHSVPPERRTPSQELLRYFKYDHLPEPLREPSRYCSELAHRIETLVPDGPEKTAGLRKLLEAKDCFARSLLPKEGEAYIGKAQTLYPGDMPGRPSIDIKVEE